MAGSRIYHFDEVAKHNDAEDCWLIVSGKVYDVSSYMAEHPGGRDVLLSATGKDATVDFENVGHSSSGRELMDNYCIGTIDSSTLPNDGEGVKAQQAPKGSADKTSEFVMRILQFIAPVMILGLAFVVRHFTK
ncbi:Cytochrome b5-like Heme/Steroid binding domain [Musa troglodytarum]|uniref:Cytochrome b5-like Heme/Steroid binding domain n=1 Tax=Musa troglodytarum TaxID=320322 RepID=A0A9E7EU44_9LILI|nr:Cytochrome b5-like Heme/Steroid binding domain [Musa troglodytarum]